MPHEASPDATAIPAVQSNKVYLPLCTPVPSTTFTWASDKRFALLGATR